MKKTAPAARSRKSGATSRKSANLELRRTPLQARGQETFERILNVTGELLDEVGTESVTTNLIAKAAGINVATLYQYFPNKRSILVTLFQRQTAQRSAVAEKEFAARRQEGGPWRDALEAAIDATFALRRGVPGVLALRQAMRSDPELLEYDREDTRNISNWLATEIVGSTSVSRDEAELVARCCVEAMAALLDMWLIESRGKDDRIIRQAKVLVESYLAPYIKGPKVPRTKRAARRR